MRRRHLYVLLFAVPTLLVSIIAATLMLAASAGVLWLFVLGDNAWPPVADTLLGSVFFVGGAASWLGLLSVAYAVGRGQESRPTLNTTHVVVSIGATVVLAVVIVVRVMGANGFGPRSESMARRLPLSEAARGKR